MNGTGLFLRWFLNLPAASQSSFLGRIKALLPPWFGNDATPILDGVLAGPAWALSFIYQLFQYITLQVRIDTATDGFLDLISADFFGSSVPRNEGETDTAFRTRILAAFFPSRVTRPALVTALTALGLTVQVIEPWNPGDTGALNEPTTLGLNTAGYYGSRTMPFQCFAIVTRPSGSSVTNAQIYAAIEAVRPVARKIWVRIVG